MNDKDTAMNELENEASQRLGSEPLVENNGVEADSVAPAANGSGSTYDEESIKVLRNRDHIRQNPGMYIGDTGVKGLHHLVYELVYNSVDEALAGYAKTIQVVIDVDGSVSVSDDGRGIPVEEHSIEKRPTLEVVMTMVGSGAKFDNQAYKVSAGLHGIGAKAVTALSEWTEAEVRRDGHTYVQEYERGLPITDVKRIGAAKRTGTKITFKPDPQIFRDAQFDFDRLEGRLRELAFLNKGLKLNITDKVSGKEEEFYYEGGIAEYVEYINSSEDPIHPPIYIDQTRENVRVEVALQYTVRGTEERVRCYANNAFNYGGGTHQSGFRLALTRTIKQYGVSEKHFKNVDPQGEDFREGLTAIVSVQVPEPQLEAQTKIRLNNPEVEGIVAGVISDHLKTYLEENPADGKNICRKVSTAAEAREAAAKARKALRDRKSILSGGGLPGKLMDCTSNDRDESELFLVEGQSAGGSAESGRDREHQAVLPLRGKVLNVEKARPEKLLNNEEICNLISAVGVDIGNLEEEIKDKVRYGKIIILTDADVDGQHIRTLLLTFFYRQMTKLVEDGFVYVARPPLYKVTQKKQSRFVAEERDMQIELMTRGMEGTSLSVFEADELGKAKAEPAKVFESEELQRLVEVITPLEDALTILERRGIDLNVFLKKVVEQKLPMFRVTLAGHERWFFTSEEVDAFRQQEQERLGQELVVEDNGGSENGVPSTSFTVQELHEVQKVNDGLAAILAWSLGPADLVAQRRIAGREPPVRFVLEHGDQQRQLPHLRELVGAIRRQGERGLVVTRFKGLGEMDPEELWDTTLDPKRRRLDRVQLDDAISADNMFRTLMGEKVEPRRDFIHQHALDVKDIDYHGA